MIDLYFGCRDKSSRHATLNTRTVEIELNTFVLLRKVYNTVVLIFMWIGFGQVCVGCVYGILTAAGRGVAGPGAACRGAAYCSAADRGAISRVSVFV